MGEGCCPDRAGETVTSGVGQIASPFDPAKGQRLLDLLPEIPFYRLNAIIGVYRARTAELDIGAQRDKLDTFIAAIRQASEEWGSMGPAVRHRLIDAWDQGHSMDGGKTWNSPFPLGETVADLPLMLSVAEEVKKDIRPNREGERSPRYALIRALHDAFAEEGLPASSNKESRLADAFTLILEGLDETPPGDVGRTVRLALRKKSPE